MRTSPEFAKLSRNDKRAVKLLHQGSRRLANAFKEGDALVALSYRSLWLSDVHLGTIASRANELLEFISEVHAERIYLVGDIVDLQQMKSRPMFPDTHIRVVTELAGLAASGT